MAIPKELRSDKVYYCQRCNRTMRSDEFYTSNNLEKYPDDGKLNYCKKCITAHVDNWDPETYLWILQEIDVPYIPDEWNKLLATWGRDKSKITGLTILGRYLSKMKLKQYKDFRWKDTEYLQELKNNEIRQTMERSGYGAAEIDDAIKKSIIGVPVDLSTVAEPENIKDEVLINGKTIPTAESAAPANDDYFAQQSGAEDDAFNDDLTDEDRRYLRLKWGKSYRPEEWVQLEQMYNDMMESYDIQTAGHIDTLKKVCKTSLKADQLLDLGDVDGAQKMVKMYEALMKAGKFTAAQNKTETDEVVDSVGELVLMCERDGFIPKYYIDQPNDKADRVLMDMQQYTHDLVTEELGLGNLIENAIKQLQDQREEEKSESHLIDDDAAVVQTEEDRLFDYSVNSVLTDADFNDFEDFEEDLQNQDYNELKKLVGEDR